MDKKIVRVIHSDIRALGYCNRGARQWFASHNLNWSSFLRQGIPSDRLLATGDSMARIAVETAYQRLEGAKHGQQ